MIDTHGRVISMLRVSVTDRCNLRCVYCMPSGDVDFLPESALLTDDEIFQAVQEGVAMGIKHVKLTGGEPLLRQGITELVRRLSGVTGIEDLSMTTNGVLLGGMAGKLAQAGLSRINVSLDTMDAERYKQVTGGGDLQKVLEGIESARRAGLNPVKLNCVVQQNPEEPDAVAVAEFAREHGCQIRFILRMNMLTGDFHGIEGGRGGHCSKCDRLRLASDGKIRPCLFSDLSFDIRSRGPRKAFELALENKPEKGARCAQNWMHGIGG